MDMEQEFTQRKDDERINEILLKVNEFHQRQAEQVIPDIQDIKRILFGNSQGGLIKEHTVNKEKINQLEKTNNSIQKGLWALFIVIFGFIAEQIISRILK